MPGFTSRLRWLPLLLCAALGAGTAAPPAAAQVGSERYASIVVDAASGNVLSAASADEQRYPASLTKMMTLYMLFEALRDRRVSLDQQVPVSAWAASMSPTKLGLQPGTAITVEQAILGLVTKSANDAAAALGEMLGGDEERFAQMMTLRARALGMTRTTFRNASGLPDFDQVTTARDLAVLARHLVQDFPVQYRYFSTPYFVFHGRMIPNHQHLLETYPGADGLKTGYIRDSGYNLATSAVHGDTRLIGIVLGAANSGERDQHMAMLLDAGFDRMGAPAVMARRDPAPGFRLPSIITAPRPRPTSRRRSTPRPIPIRPARGSRPSRRSAAAAPHRHDAGAGRPPGTGRPARVARASLPRANGPDAVPRGAAGLGDAAYPPAPGGAPASRPGPVRQPGARGARAAPPRPGGTPTAPTATARGYDAPRRTPTPPARLGRADAIRADLGRARRAQPRVPRAGTSQRAPRVCRRAPGHRLR